MHPRDNEPSRTTRLTLIQRLIIAIEVASALDYLHHNCKTPTVHCHRKRSNVLLDQDMVAHVGDFGLAKFLFEEIDIPHKNQTMSVGLRSSIGYIPPEMFSREEPTDDAFKDRLSIHQFTAMALPNHVIDIVDPSILFFGENDDGVRNENDIEEIAMINVKHIKDNAKGRTKQCLVSVNVAYRKMNAIRESYLKYKNNEKTNRL
ncbi:hypothetical protein FNV43_RR10473 [Rhamnella rubrinervis]|uniref:Protein kinase domain-containing protein n=1 Tax=Rhamnella rubrinervis TaxID=2594499 RepID=A0A8K0HBY1_9ROSA|nr:hypothetical protein FNV43_RR10473 [Rhamnella rubrinervis]